MTESYLILCCQLPRSTNRFDLNDSILYIFVLFRSTNDRILEYLFLIAS